MKRKLLSVALGLSMVAWAFPAYALLDNTAIILKDKDVRVLELVDKTVRVGIIPTMVKRDFTGAAEAQALLNQWNIGNTDGAVEGTAPGDQQIDILSTENESGAPIGYGWHKEALIDNSVNDNTGIIGVNQDVGNMVNQANNVAFALSSATDSITHSQSHADQVNAGNYHSHVELLPRVDGELALPPDYANLSATITDSVNGNSGIVGVNQNAGSMNNQGNSVALAVGTGASVALSEADLGQVNAGNTIFEVETVKRNLISGSVSGNSGVVQVNQSVGNMNNQASVMSLGFLTSSASITVPGAN